MQLEGARALPELLFQMGKGKVNDLPVSVIASWPTPNYVNPETRDSSLLIVNSILLILASIVFFLRLYTRIFIKRWFGWDDSFMIVTWVAISSALW